MNYQKSSLNIYNNTATTIDATTPTPATFGNIATNTGCSIRPQLNGAQVLHGGLYEITFDASFLNGTTAGALTAQLYRDGVPVPQALATDAVGATEDGSLSFTTVIPIMACNVVKPIFTVVFSSPTITAITINHVALTMIKQA